MNTARLEKLPQQRQHIEERIKQAEAVQRTLARKKETREKILLGALLKEWMAREPDIAQRVREELSRFLVRPVDRQVFGFTQKDPELGQEP